MESLSTNFSHYFRVTLATTSQQRRLAYSIRYQVYVKELSWEPNNELQLETDDCDNYAYHCLLEHKQSRNSAGCVRLVLPQIARPRAILPCQAYEIPMKPNRHISDFNDAPVGEVSRLAVPSSFRRRREEAGKPFILNYHSTTTIYTEEERRKFPNISIGLYLSALALVDLCNLERVLVVMEPRLQRHLQRYGLVFHQISELFELHGKRALFELSAEELTANMNEEIFEFYSFLRQQIHNQFDQLLQLQYDNSAQSNEHL